jgi:ribosomal protein S18 acetylase RimI-like enzyme
MLNNVECALRYRWHKDADAVPTFEGWREALRAQMNEAQSSGARIFSTRVITRELGTHPGLTGARATRLREVLVDLGFRRAGDRAEFSVALDAHSVGEWLRSRAAGDPFRWHAMAPAGEARLEDAAKLLRRASTGDPATDPDEDAVGFIRAALGDRTLTREPTCVQVGRLPSAKGRVDAAFVMAQVNPENGWSRITYLGLVPEHRGRGLGGYVHARGVAMLREQGGTRYHGGTSTANAPMLALFRALGAEETSEMEEWRFNTPPAP